ncbi:MAG TPA: S26 family signal peptidase [Isosphaeraceae bacterium]|jgi:signal peptidase I|nr:S26 family signal peptidase [Isosphaeraceae bacterium]
MTRTATAEAANKPATPPKDKERPKEGHRETIESIVVAFLLALLVRGFAAEAFVIPTGSMAPTLMGRHKQATCVECGEEFVVNAAEEVEGGTAVIGGLCSNCRFPNRLDDAPSFKGDRILVMKFPFDLPFLPGAGLPKRWDVIVFKYPENPEQNYIKRLVGLPDEELMVRGGDILTRPRGSDGPFRIERKPLGHQRAMQMLVYDDAHRPRSLKGLPEWRRWTSESSTSWREGPTGTFSVDVEAGGQADPAGWAVLRYRNIIPDARQWEAIAQGQRIPHPPRATLITDNYSYNTTIPSYGSPIPPHWVGDLTIESRLEVKSSAGLVRYRLVKGGVDHDCVLDLAKGEAQCFRNGRPIGPKVSSGIKAQGTHDVTFANVDGRLTLWVDGRTPFGDGVAYDDGAGTPPTPKAADLTPVSIAGRDGAKVAISDLILRRDIYYTQDPSGGSGSDYDGLWTLPSFNRDDPAQYSVDLFNLLADPGRFGTLTLREPRTYSISPDHYMMMGDNSPRSKDGRAWENRDRDWDPNERQSWEVPRAALIGKAFFVYWPHGKPFGPDIRITHDLRIPFRPYLERMKWIR